MVQSFTLLVGQSVAAQSGGGGGLMQILLLLVPMIAVMYFLMIRPERKRQSDHQTMIGALKRGDEIVLTSGIIGKIHAIEDKSLVIEIGVADKVRVKVLKVAVSGLASRYLGGAEAPKKLDDKSEKKDDKTDKKDEKKDDSSEKKSA